MGTQNSGQAIDTNNYSDTDLQCVGGVALAVPVPPSIGVIGKVIGVNAFQTPPGSFVQSLSAVLNAGSATTTITATVNLGDTLILYVYTTQASTNKISSITDSLGNTWSLADTYNPASQGQVTLWSAFNAISSGSITITITLAGATGNAGVAVGGEYFGVLWQNGDFAGTTGTSATLAGGSISASFANTETPTTVTVAFGYGANGTLIPTPYDVNAYGYFYTQRAQPSTNYSFTDVVLGGNPSSADAPAFKPQWTQASSGAYVTANAVFYAQPVAAQLTLIANNPQVSVIHWGNASTALAAPTAIGSVVTSGNVITVTSSLAVNTTSLRAVSNYGTAPSAVAALGVNAYVTNQLTVVGTGTFAVQAACTQSTSPWVVSLASTTITGTVAVDGALTNNNAAPGATLLGVLPAMAETAYTTITYNTGDMVLPVTDLHGAMNSDLQAVAGTALGAPSALGTIQTMGNIISTNTALMTFNRNSATYLPVSGGSSTIPLSTYSLVDVNLVGMTGSVLQVANPVPAWLVLGSGIGTPVSVAPGPQVATGAVPVVPAGGNIVLQASQVSGVANATTTRTTTTGLGGYAKLAILLNITGAGVATGTLKLFLEDSFDGGTTWQDLVAFNSFTFGAALTTQLFYVQGELIPSSITTATSTNLTQGAAAAAESATAPFARQGPWGDRIRVREVVSGVSGSPTGVTYTINCVAKA